MGDTNIEWTDRVWNPIRGCSRVSAGCVHCYAEVMAARFARQWGTPEIVRPDGGWSGVLSFVESKLTEPLHWRAPQKVFVNSMSDLFHEKVPDEWIDRVFAVMALSPQHTFQVLTKRPERMRAYLSAPDLMDRRRAAFKRHGGRPAVPIGPLPNVWLGVSVEDQATADARVPLLLQPPAAVRFVSYEPALGPVDFAPWLQPFHARGVAPTQEPATWERSLDWIIVGGESGPGARPFDVAWARSTIAQCRAAGVACFVKQLGAQPRGLPIEAWEIREAEHDPSMRWRRLRDRKGGDMEEWPEDLRVREFPAVRDA